MFRNHDSQSGYYRYDHHLVSEYLAFVATIVGYGIWGTLLGPMKPGGLHRYRYWCL